MAMGEVINGLITIYNACLTTLDTLFTLVLVIVACVGICLTVKNLRFLKRQLQTDTFSSFLVELSSEEASKDRGLVKENIKPDTSIMDIRERIEEGRRPLDSKIGMAGAAAERTMARLDRVGFFLLGTNDHPTMDPPIWVWTMANDFWERLGEWVVYRQTQENDSDYYGYCRYFQKLAKLANAKIEEDKQRVNYHPMK